MDGLPPEVLVGETNKRTSKQKLSEGKINDRDSMLSILGVLNGGFFLLRGFDAVHFFT